jgi:hypothetical protein
MMSDSNEHLFSNASFDPETVDLLSHAFEDAWQKIQISGFRLGRPAYAYASREIMAKHVVSLAQYGERDSIVLSDSAVDFLTTNYEA